jgi:pimeloyl-ACP methyl ester carboxylesterase
MTDVEAVSFPNKAGQTLFGTLHRPARKEESRTDASRPVIVLLSPGVKMRVGPGRLYVPLTDMLCDEGFSVLRFDFYGLGDSEGELAEKLLPDVYNHIEVGRYVDDTLAAMQWLRTAHGVKRFVLGGLCGGAITALLAAERDPSVEGLLSLGMTVTLASNAATPGKYMTAVQLDGRRKQYIKKLLSPTAWFRLLTFRSDYSVIWHSTVRKFLKKPPAKAAVTATAPDAAPAGSAVTEQRGNANPMFPPAYFKFLGRGGKAFMLFSGKDRLQSEYEEKFAQPFAARLAPFEAQIDKHIVAEANHVLALHEWQREMVDASRAWTRKYFQAP